MKEKMNREIKPFQLITGSYVIFNKDVFMVYTINDEDSSVWIRNSNHDVKVFINALSGIPITLDVLRDIEWMVEESSYYIFNLTPEDAYSPSRLVIDIRNEQCEITRSGISALTLECKFLHQLQFILLALTGQSITFKKR